MKGRISRLRRLGRLTSRSASSREPDAEAERARHHRWTILLTMGACDRTNWSHAIFAIAVACILVMLGFFALYGVVPPAFSLIFFIPAALAATIPWIPAIVFAHHGRAMREEFARQEGTEVPRVGAALFFRPDEATVQAGLRLDRDLDDAVLALVQVAVRKTWRVSQVHLAHARAHAFLLALGHLPSTHPLVERLRSGRGADSSLDRVALIDAVIEAARETMPKAVS